MLIGAVADDITGAADLCLTLSRKGLRTLQLMGEPQADVPFPDVDAVVVALKSRTLPADEAVAMSLAAARRLQAEGAYQLLFKYCSTFDSTDAGNIGPVCEALLALLGCDLTIACPGFPANGRTVYKGHLFVGDQLLSDSTMKDHPLTPMRDANLVRVLGRQTALSVGLLDLATLRQGSESTRAAIVRARTEGVRILIADTLTDDDLMTVGAACRDMPLVTGGSGIALGLAQNFIDDGTIVQTRSNGMMKAADGRSVTLAGSCSAATRRQIAAARVGGMPTLEMNVAALVDGTQTAAGLADWAIAQSGPMAPLIYSSADPDALAATQVRFGRHASGALVEKALAEVACILQSRGFTRFIVAGGETAGAVVTALGVKMIDIGPEIDAGVPWTRSIGDPDVSLALKSGNFGKDDFFLRAWTLLDTEVAP